ncbi:arsenosugar biosynthesis radical SAM (seleno)protein ArsS [Planctomycetaceae bacterium SH139]
MQLSLMRRNAELANAAFQRKILERPSDGQLPLFDDQLRQRGLPELRAGRLEVLQINVGKVCNQTCTHCHVDAGPDRRESITREIAEQVIRVIDENDIATLDITGGAPEMNPHFRWLVEQARALGRRVIDRCNLTILTAQGYRDLPRFLADHQVEIVASLPCYLEDNCDSQRGSGVFQRSIEALRELNALGYGADDSGLVLNLVYNPIGAKLPPAQSELEVDYRRELNERYGIVFTALHTITNLPISRFLDDLLREAQFDAYMRTLVEAFNPLTLSDVMCRSMISVDWEGRLFDCDFNQMLNIELDSRAPQHINDFNLNDLHARRIATGRHCFGCTAGAGSSCQGALVSLES